MHPGDWATENSELEFRHAVEPQAVTTRQGRRPGDAGTTNGGKPLAFFPRLAPLSNVSVRITLVVVVSLLFSGGCSFPSWDGSKAPVDRSDPLLTTLLTGDAGGWETTTGFAFKPSSSLSQHSFSEEGGDADPDVSPDGNWIVYSSLQHTPNPDIYVKRTAGATVTRLTSDPASEMQPAFSPLGDKVAYASNRSGSFDIWVVGVDGTNSVRMTSSSSNDIHPSWSPDGQQIAYCSSGSRSGQWELWIVDVQTPSIKKMIGYGLNPVWCPNPEIPKIAYQLARFRGDQWYSIWTVDYVEGDAKFPTEIVSSVDYACISPAWAEDGTYLSYSTVSQGPSEKGAQWALPQSSGEAVFIIATDGRNNLRLTHEDASNFSPTWSADGRVFFCSDRKGINNIWSMKPYLVDLTGEATVDLSAHPLNRFQAN